MTFPAKAKGAAAGAATVSVAGGDIASCLPLLSSFLSLLRPSLTAHRLSGGKRGWLCRGGGFPNSALRSPHIFLSLSLGLPREGGPSAPFTRRRRGKTGGKGAGGGDGTVPGSPRANVFHGKFPALVPSPGVSPIAPSLSAVVRPRQSQAQTSNGEGGSLGSVPLARREGRAPVYGRVGSGLVPGCGRAVRGAGGLPRAGGGLGPPS